MGVAPNGASRMDSLTLRQVASLRDAIHERLGWMTRVRERMEKVGFVKGDELYELVKAAEDKLHTLWVTLHYEACGQGVCRLSSRTP
jgi:hypothetical protein